MGKKFFDSPLVRSRITSDKVRPKEMILGYLLSPFLATLSNAIFGSYLNRYYSDVLGWTDWYRFGAFSAILPIVSVIFVVLGNLMVGHLIDTTRTSQGKARPYLLLSAPVVTIAIALLFMTPTSTSPKMQMIWIALSYNLYYSVGYPLFFTSQSSMVAVSTRDGEKRSLLATFANASGVAAIGIGASVLVPILLQSFLFAEKDGVIDPTLSYQHWRVLMVALCIVTFCAIIMEYFFTRERITEENSNLNLKEEKVPMGKQVKACVTSKFWWIMMIHFFLFQFSGMVKNGSMSYYCRWMFEGINNEAAAGNVMGTLGLVGGLPTALGMLIAWPIANKLGKKRAIQMGLIFSVLGGAVSLLNVHNFVIVCVGIVLKGIGSIPPMYVTLALLSDVLEHLEAKNGFRSDGFAMSIYGAIMGSMAGLGNGVINFLLSRSGYDAAAAVQNGSVQSMLVLCFLGMELICYAISAVLMTFQKVEKNLDEDKKLIQKRQKEAVLAAGGTWNGPEEDITVTEQAVKIESQGGGL